MEQKNFSFCFEYSKFTYNRNLDKNKSCQEEDFPLIKENSDLIYLS